VEGYCGSEPILSVACIGFGPGDATIGVGAEGVGNDSLFNFQNAGIGRIEGIYAEAPLKGTFVWNSHAFNITDVPGKLDIWVNLEFAAPEEQTYQLRRFSAAFAQFGIDVPPFATRQYCAHHVVPSQAHVLELSSHNHKRGKRFEVWIGRFACAGGPNDGAACSPLEIAGGLPHPERCAGAPCIAFERPAAGDCNGDLTVTVDELVTGINVSLGATEVQACAHFDIDTNGRVSIDELVTGVNALLHPHLRHPQDSLIYVSLTYADPTVTRFDPPMTLAASDSSDAERTLTYCSIYDNGYTDPTTVKRQSTSPLPSQGFAGGGPCEVTTGCTAGRVREPCSGETSAQRDASCDSSPGAGDGECDGCMLRFGTTTEDEMFILLGAYYID
jgi:hypothetical protein